MAENEISEEVKSFITDHIGSIAQLEMLLLVRARRGTALSAEAVARELGIDARWAASNLHDLAAKGFLTERPGELPVYVFAPQSPELEHTIAAVATAYTERRLTIVNLIFNKPVRIFADAFRFRRN